MNNKNDKKSQKNKEGKVFDNVRIQWGIRTSTNYTQSIEK